MKADYTFGEVGLFVKESLDLATLGEVEGLASSESSSSDNSITT
jgi:hypothetical protein